MLRIIAILFGIVFIFAGVAGFMPTFVQNDLLFGYFMVSQMHNLVHIVTGVLAIMAATNFKATKIFFIVFGLVYTIVAIWGFYSNGDLIMMHVNLADNVLHITVGVLALYLGLSAKEGRV